MHPESLYAERALRPGALGYVNKDQATAAIIKAIRRVRQGKVWLSEAMAERLLQWSVGAARQEATLAGGNPGRPRTGGSSPDRAGLAPPYFS
jgi:DNA-binding NarL/FixJ family response regulator